MRTNFDVCTTSDDAVVCALTCAWHALICIHSLPRGPSDTWTCPRMGDTTSAGRRRERLPGREGVGAVEFCIPYSRVVDVATHLPLAVISALYIHVYKGVGGGIVLVPTHRRLVLRV